MNTRNVVLNSIENGPDHLINIDVDKKPIAMLKDGKVYLADDYFTYNEVECLDLGFQPMAELKDKEASFEDLKEVKTLDDLLKIQLQDGNWNYDPYMFGMANGMIFCLSVLKNEEPKYLEAPKEWLSDRHNHLKPKEFKINDISSNRKYRTYREDAEDLLKDFRPLQNEIWQNIAYLINRDHPAAAAIFKNFFEQNQAQKNGKTPQNASQTHKETLKKTILLLQEIEEKATSLILHRELKNSPNIREQLEDIIKLSATDVYSKTDTKNEVFKEIKPQHKNSSHACEIITPYFDFVGSYIKSNTEFLSLGHAKEKLSLEGFISLREKIDARYQMYLDAIHLESFTPPTYTLIPGVAASFGEMLMHEGIKAELVTAYKAANGLRIVKYTADGVRHLSVSHPDRLPKIQEVHYFRDILYPELDQMALVLEHDCQKLYETNTITLIELFYK